MKRVATVLPTPGQHWVGDGFPVRSLFSYGSPVADVSPFLLLDHAGPHSFERGDVAHPRGVGVHPHRGFETVTIVYDGEVAHRDSAGHGGTIGPGDVQWMTAAAGVLHEEFHSQAYTRSGGPFHMVQLWVNLPAQQKMSPPGYQPILAQDIPRVTLPDDAGQLRVIAGLHGATRGPARAFTPLNVWDMQLRGGAAVQLVVPAGHNVLAVVLAGQARGTSQTIVVYASIVVTLLLSWITLHLAERLVKRMGQTGIRVMTRIMGLLLAAIAVQFVITGIREAMMR